MQSDWIIYLAAILAVIISITTIIIFFQLRTTRLIQRVTRNEIIQSVEYLSQDILEVKSGHPSIADEKKLEIQKMGPKTFYYIDESQVKDLYLQIFNEPEPKRIETREKKEVKGGVSAKTPVIEPKFEKGKAEETTKIYDIEQTPALMYNKIERYLFDKDKVTFGLDEFEFEQS